MNATSPLSLKILSTAGSISASHCTAGSKCVGSSMCPWRGTRRYAPSPLHPSLLQFYPTTSEAILPSAWCSPLLDLRMGGAHTLFFFFFFSLLVQFCIETVTRFTKNPMCLHKAGTFHQSCVLFTSWLCDFLWVASYTRPPPLCLQEPCLRATTATTRQACISPCRCS